jgi:hypothetical protein
LKLRGTDGYQTRRKSRKGMLGAEDGVDEGFYEDLMWGGPISPWVVAQRDAL